MRFVFITLLTFLSCVHFYAQNEKVTSGDKPFDFSLTSSIEPDCPDANSYAIREGKVIKIINGKTIVFAVDNEYEKETYKVILAGIDVSSNSSVLMKILTENFLNQNVRVIGEESKTGNKKIFGEILPYAPNKIGSPNLYFLENGLAKYVEPKRHLVPNWTLCRYRREANQAKEKKIGIWAK